MGNFIQLCVVLLVITLGTATMLMLYYLVYGLGFVVWCKLTGAKLPAESCVSVSSIPTMLSAETVVEYIRNLPNDSKREAYVKLLDSMKRLVTEMCKRPASYPANKLSFAKGQLKSQITRSTVSGCMETVKFRQLAELFLETELSKEGLC